ncbi:STAS domain-containing protein [Streptomyces sp. NPDC054887]
MTAETRNLNVEVEIPDPDTAVMTVGGDLDFDTSTLLNHHLANQIAHGRRHLVLDLSGLDFIDSSGLNVLVKANRETRLANDHLYLVAPAPAVRRLLEITGMSAVTPTCATVEEALAARSRTEARAAEAPAAF